MRIVALQEIDRESSQGHVNQEQLRHMPYTEACVKEALRLYPPATALARQLTQDMQIMGHRVPKGTGIFVSPPACFLTGAAALVPAAASRHCCWVHWVMHVIPHIHAHIALSLQASCRS